MTLKSDPQDSSSPLRDDAIVEDSVAVPTVDEVTSKSTKSKVRKITSEKSVDKSETESQPADNAIDLNESQRAPSFAPFHSASTVIVSARNFAKKRPILFGGLLGALIALSVTFGMSQYPVSTGPTIAEVSAQTTSLASSVSSNTQRLSGLEADIAQSISLAIANTETLSGYGDKFDEFTLRLDKAEQLSIPQQSLGSPMFGVATAQLLNKVTSGETFAPEWINIYSMADSNMALQQQLEQLMPMAQTGVRTIPELQSSLDSFRERVFFPSSSLGRFWVETLSSMQYKLGLPIARSVPEENALQILDQSIIYLQNKEVARATDLVASMPSPYPDNLRAWIDSARRHQLAVTVAKNISLASEEALRLRLQ